MRPVMCALLAATLLSGASACHAEVPRDPLRAPARTPADTIARRDTLVRRDGVVRRDTTGRRDTLASRGTHSPGLAMLFSAILPGAGQLYNRSYWKVPVVLGLGVYFASTWLDQNRRTGDYRQKYAASLLPGAPDANLSSQYLSEREFYKEQRDTFAWYFVILYLVNIADAYVDASLYDFDVGPDLTLRVLPLAPVPAGPGVTGPAWSQPAAPGPGLTLRLAF